MVYDLDDLATAVTLEALRVDGRALEAPGFYRGGPAARARSRWPRTVWKSTSELGYRIDGVGRPKFDFHTGPGGAEAEPRATTLQGDRRARRRRHPQSGGRAARAAGHAHRRRINGRRVAGPRRRLRKVVATAGPAPLFRGRRALGDSLRAAKALLALGPTATCAVERVSIERDRSLTVKMTLARPALPDIVLVVRLTVDGSINAIDTTSVTVGGAASSQSIRGSRRALDRAGAGDGAARPGVAVSRRRRGRLVGCLRRCFCYEC